MTAYVPPYGPSLQDWQRQVALAVNRLLQEPPELLNVMSDFGVIGDASTDDTVAFQNAVNSGSPLLIPDGCIVRCTSPITSSKRVSIFGEGTFPYGGVSGPVGSNPTQGSWIHFDHSGVGITIDGTSSYITGIRLSNFGTYRNQPAPASGWTPNANDYDISIIAGTAQIDDLMLLNPTKGISFTNGSRMTARNICGQFMQVGIYLDKCYDTCFLDTFRNWSFWADNSYVESYQSTNCDTLYLLRCDNPQFSNVFSIRHRSGIRIGTSATSGGLSGGTTSKLKVANLDADLGTFGILFDSTASGATAVVENFSAQADNLTSSCGVQFDNGAVNNLLSLVNVDIRNMNENAIRNAGTGTGNVVNIGGYVYINGWNMALGTFPAFEASTGNTIIISAYPTYLSGNGGANTGGAGTFKTATYT